MKTFLLWGAAAALLASGSAGWAQATAGDTAGDAAPAAVEEGAAEGAEEGVAPAAAAAPAARPFGARTLEIGAAGLMERSNRTDLDPIRLTAGAMQSAGDYTLLSGGYYRITIASDGTQEQAIEGPELFRNVWINEIVINDLEVRPLGLDSIEFDDAGEVELSFVAVTPGRYELRIRGASGDTQRARFTIQ